jgi:hypothetical protein
MPSARRKQTWMAKLALLVLGTFACMMLAVLIPMLAHRHGAIDPNLVTTTLAAEIDLLSGREPIVLSQRPKLLLNRGWLSHDSKGDVKDSPRLVLQSPEFALELLTETPWADFVADQDHNQAQRDTKDATADLVETLYDALTNLGFENLTIRNGTLRLVHSGGFETVTGIDLEMSGRKRGLTVSKGSFGFRGQRLTFDATVGTATENGPKSKRRVTRVPLQTTVSGPLFSVNFDGAIETATVTSLKGQIETSSANLRDVARWLGIEFGTGVFSEPLTLKGQYTWADGAMSFEKAAITLNGQPASGAFAVSVTGGRPSIDATLAFQNLDLTPLIAVAMPRGQPVEQLTQNWSGLDVTWPVVRQLDADLRVSSARVTYAGQPLGRGAATVSMKSGRVNIDVAELTVHGSPVNAQVAVNMAPLMPVFHVRGKLDALDLAAAGAAVFGRDVGTGKASASFDMTGQGTTLGAVIRSADGKLALRSTELVRVPVDFKSIRAQAQMQGRSRSPAGWGLVNRAGTALDSVDIRMIVKGGAAEIEHGTVRSGNQWLVTKGRVDVRQETLDLLLALRPARAQDRVVRPVDLLESDLISLSGPWAEPAFRMHEAPPPP